MYKGYVCSRHENIAIGRDVICKGISKYTHYLGELDVLFE